MKRSAITRGMKVQWDGSEAPTSTPRMMTGKVLDVDTIRVTIESADGTRHRVAYLKLQPAGAPAKAPRWHNISILVELFIDYGTLGSDKFHIAWDYVIDEIVAAYNVANPEYAAHSDFNDHIRWAMQQAKATARARKAMG